MFRSFATATILVSCLTAAGWAQSPATSGAPAAATPAKPVTKKAAPKAKAAAKQPVAETGPCRLGVISALGDQFSVQKFGLTIFENEENEAPMNGWGLDDLPFARVRAATGADPSVRRIASPTGSVRTLLQSEIEVPARSKRGLAGNRQGHHLQRKLRTLFGHHEVQRDGAGHQNGDQGHRRVQSGHRIFSQTLPSVRQCCGQHVRRRDL